MTISKKQLEANKKNARISFNRGNLFLIPIIMV